MNTANAQSSLLRRTKFAQSRTAYNTVNNTLLGVHQRQVYVVEPFEQAKNNRQLVAIRKAFASRRNSRKGPFQRLLAPHAYSDLFGDPTYYSNKELHRTCTMAAEMRLTDRLFWWQICEKLRKVRDIMNINRLLSCLSSVISVKYFDPDLLRMMSREFVDDMNKLSLAEIAELMQCYVRANVFSVDLVNAAGNSTAARLLTHVKGALNTESSRVDDQHDNATDCKAEDSLTARPETLGSLAKCFKYFGYRNRDLYLSIAFLAIKHWRHLDLYGKCAVFSNLDPRDFQPENTGAENTVSAETALEITRDTTNAMMRLFSVFDDSYYVKDLHSITSEAAFGDIVPPNHTGEYDEYVKRLHHLCCASGAVNNLAKVVCRLVDNIACTSEDVTCTDFSQVLDVVMAKMASISSMLMSHARNFEIVSRNLHENVPKVTDGDRGDEGGDRMHIYASPSVNAARCVFVDSLLRSVCAVNATLRYRLRNVACENEVLRGSKLGCSVSDANMHTKLYEPNDNKRLSEEERALLAQFMDAIETYGCRSQAPELLTTALETLSVASTMNCEYAAALREQCQTASNIISWEIVKHLVCFSDEARYRVLLAMHEGKLVPDAYLEHAIGKFTKYVRMSKCGTEFAVSSPYQFLLKEGCIPSGKVQLNAIWRH